MKKTLLAITVLSLIVGSAFISSYAAPIERGYVSVSTSANTEVAPDVAEISFAVETFDTKSLQKATQMNKEISDKVLSELSGMLTSANGDYIKTSNFNASPVYSYSGSKRNLDKYQVSNRVIVHTKSLDKVGSMIDKAIASGATNVDSLEFSVSNYDNQCNDLLSIATKKAQKRAGLLAKELSTSIDGVRTLDISCNANNYHMPRMYMAKNMMADTAEGAVGSGSTSISGGVIKIYANVNASFFVK